MLTAEIDLRYLETQHERGQLTVGECLEFFRELAEGVAGAEQEAAGVVEDLEAEIESLRADLAEEREANRKGAAGAALVAASGRRDAAAARVFRLAMSAVLGIARDVDDAAVRLAGPRLAATDKERVRHVLRDAADRARRILQEIERERQEAEREGDGAGADPGVTPAAGVVPAVGAVG